MTSRSLGGLRRLPQVPHARRALAVAALLALVAGVAALDGRTSPVGGTPRLPVGAAGARALSSAWYCPVVPTGSPGDIGHGEVVVTNVTGSGLSGTAITYDASGEADRRSVAVPPHSRVALAPRSTAVALTPGATGGGTSTAPAAAPVVTGMLVELDGGGAVVDQVVRTVGGSPTTPCATRPASTWYLADGSTRAGTLSALSLLNPSGEDAVVDVTFSTDDGTTSPVDDQGLVVPAGHQVVVPVDSQVRRRDWYTAAVVSRSVSIVAGFLQRDGGTMLGAAAGPMVSAPSADWWFPDGVVTDGVSDRVVLMNPGDREAATTVRVLPDQGAPVDIDVHVPARARTAIDLGGDSRIPKDVRYSIHVAVTAGSPIVAQHASTSVAPAPVVGGTAEVGAQRPNRTWGTAAGSSVGAADEWLYVLNPGTTAVQVRVDMIGDGREEQSEARVEPGRRLLVHVDEVGHGADRSVRVSAGAPVVVGRVQAGDGPGYSSSLAAPLAD